MFALKDSLATEGTPVALQKQKKPEVLVESDVKSSELIIHSFGEREIQNTLRSIEQKMRGGS